MENILPFTIPILALMIPIVAILTAHQRKMAELIHSQNQINPQSQHQIAEMQREINELKSLVHQQTLALDEMSGFKAMPPVPTEDLRNRL